MILRSPFFISSRLLPALQIAGATIQLDYSRRPGRDGRTVSQGETKVRSRTRYEWTIDLPSGKSFTASDLQSGCDGGSLTEGFLSFLSFLSACAESYARRGIDGENADLFPVQVAEWAATYSDEIAMAQIELEEAMDSLCES